MRGKQWGLLGIGFLAGSFSGFFGMKAWRGRRRHVQLDDGMYVEGGAVNAVTGGHPEEMNEMPPNTSAVGEEPIYDGSILSQSR